MLRPSLVESLRTERIGTSPRQLEGDLQWIRNLPIAELHCHLGGNLSPDEMIDSSLVSFFRPLASISDIIL